jgi:hypothetical protein
MMSQRPDASLRKKKRTAKARYKLRPYLQGRTLMQCFDSTVPRNSDPSDLFRLKMG